MSTQPPGSSDSERVHILRGSRTVLLTGIVASFAFIIGTSFKELVFALLDQCVPEKDNRIERKVVRFVVVATIFTALSVLLYRYTTPHQKIHESSQREHHHHYHHHYAAPTH